MSDEAKIQESMQKVVAARGGGAKTDPKPETPPEGSMEPTSEPITDTKPEAAAETTASSPEPSEAAQKIIESIKSKPENKGKTDEEIQNLLAQELKKGPSEPQEEKTTPDVNAIIKERSGGRFESVEALLEAAAIEDIISKKSDGRFKSIDEALAASKPVELSERLKKLKELEDKGVDIEKVLQFRSLGVGKLDPSKSSDAVELLKLQMKQKHPEITETEMALEIEDTYQHIFSNPEELEDGDKRKRELALSRLSRNARQAKTDLEKLEKELELPSTKVDSAYTDQQLKDLQRAWENTVRESVRDYRNLDLKIGDSDFKYNLDGESVNQTASLMNLGGNLTGRYMGKDGKVNMEAFRQEMTILNNWPKILKSVKDQGYSEGQLEMIKKWSNAPRTPKGGAAPRDSAQVTPAKKMAEALKAEGLLQT